MYVAIRLGPDAPDLNPLSDFGVPVISALITAWRTALQLGLTPYVGALLFIAAGLTAHAWWIFRHPARHAGPPRVLARLALLGVSGFGAGAGLAVIGVDAPPAALLIVATVLATAALALLVERRHPHKGEPGETRARIAVVPASAVLSAINMGSTLYLLSALSHPLIALLGDDGALAGFLVPIASAGLGVTAILVAPLRRWDARNVAWLASAAWCVPAIVLLAVLPGLATSTFAAWLTLAACSFAIGASGISMIVLWPYVSWWVANRTKETIEHASGRQTAIWGTLVGVLFLGQLELATPARLGWEVTALVHAALLAISVPLLRMLPRDRRPLDRVTPVLKVWRATLAPVVQWRRHRGEALAFFMSALSGAELQLFYGTYALILTAWGATGFGGLVGGAFLVAMAVMEAIRKRMSGVRLMWVGAALMAVAFVASLLAALAGIRNGWIAVGLAFVVELATTLFTAMVPAALLDPARPDEGNGLQNGGKYLLGALLAALAPTMFGLLGDPAWILLVGTLLAAAMIALATVASRERPSG